jgi:acetyl esterase
MDSLPTRIVRSIASFILVVFGLGTVGSLFPAIPVLGELGSILIFILGLWLTVLSLVGAAWTFRRWSRSNKRCTLLVAGLAVFAALGSLYIQWKQISVARENGARIDLAQVFLAHSQSDEGLRPETIIYARQNGQELPLDIYRPAKGPAPIFVYIHGGGWGRESLKQR